MAKALVRKVSTGLRLASSESQDSSGQSVQMRSELRAGRMGHSTNLLMSAFSFFWADGNGGFWMLGVGLLIWMVLNSGALLFGVYFPPLWPDGMRLRRLRFHPDGIPIIAVATPFWIAVSMTRTWIEDGAFMALGPFVLTSGLAILLFVGTLCLHRFGRPTNEPVPDRQL